MRPTASFLVRLSIRLRPQVPTYLTDMSLSISLTRAKHPSQNNTGSSKLDFSAETEIIVKTNRRNRKIFIFNAPLSSNNVASISRYVILCDNERHLFRQTLKCPNTHKQQIKLNFVTIYLFIKSCIISHSIKKCISQVNYLC